MPDGKTKYLNANAKNMDKKRKKAITDRLRQALKDKKKNTRKRKREEEELDKKQTMEREEVCWAEGDREVVQIRGDSKTVID